MQLSARAYAKVNLTLDILGKREDGYHILKMILQSVSLYDTVSVWTENSGTIALTCTWEEVPCDEKNTAYKAASAFFSATGLQNKGLGIKIKKRIPSGAGLGGGSADAAAVLHLLDKLYETKLSAASLCEIGVQVGADVPFCLMGGTMLAEGIGARLTPLCDLDQGYFVIVKPDENISTAYAYSRWDEVGSTRVPDTDKAQEAIFEHNLPALGAQLCNAFEEVVEVPALKQIRSVMYGGGALGAALSGSGSAVFGLFEEKSVAEDCKHQLEDGFAHVFLCRPVPEGVALE